MILDGYRRLRATAALAAFALLATACSSSPPKPPPPLNQTVEKTSWLGACRGLEVGTYALTFGPATANRGSAQIRFPDAAKGTQTADYTVTYANREQTLTLELPAPWTGTFVRDAENLNWDVRVGNPPTGGGLCRLFEVGTAYN